MIYFISYGNYNFTYALNRIIIEAHEFKLFDVIIGYTDNDLKNDTTFWNQHSEFINNNNRGGGYWLWKSYLLLKTLYRMKDNDILIYADSGCDLLQNRKHMIQEYISLLQKYDILCTSTKRSEKKWTKQDLFLYLQTDDNTEQLQASYVIVKKTPKIVNFVSEWYRISCNYHLLNDSPSNEKNHSSFIEHRHDQSIFSLLCKQNLTYKLLTNGPIIISRNRKNNINFIIFTILVWFIILLLIVYKCMR